jgi:hypothetical protein
MVCFHRKEEPSGSHPHSYPSPMPSGNQVEVKNRECSQSPIPYSAVSLDWPAVRVAVKKQPHVTLIYLLIPSAALWSHFTSVAKEGFFAAK